MEKGPSAARVDPAVLAWAVDPEELEELDEPDFEDFLAWANARVQERQSTPRRNNVERDKRFIA
jgi:hypothetical protein